ncbi:hypothetical protein FB639_000878 [Coemansia asiatica]|nr:hypothetical protein FB639_000878 [Coemansia asiatica]
MDLNTLSSSSSKTSFGFAPFATAAVFSLVLLLTESLYLFAKLPETLNFRDKSKPQLADSSDTLVEDQSDQEMPKTPKVPEVSARTKHVLRRLNCVHFAYLFFFSGMEYTLTFLTHDKFDFSNAQQGMLLGFIGITSTLLQGGYVRRVKGKSAHRDKSLVAQGMLGNLVGLISIAICCMTHEHKNNGSVLDGNKGQPSMWLWIGALGFAIASATVVNCLNSMVSLVGVAENTNGGTGKRLGDFRSTGQIGRALGPMFACSVYWLSGATTCYFVGSIAVAVITALFIALVPANISLVSSHNKQD